MADITPNGFAPSLRNRIGGVFRRIGAAFGAAMEAQSRRAQVERLEALTDAQLAEIGLKRDEILRHVFADRWGF